MTKSYHCIVIGKVKGGTFQSWVMDQAQQMGLTGWVRYIEDNKAEILLQGELVQCSRFRDKLKADAPLPEVQSIKCEFIDHDKQFDSFEMRG
ncbi:MAG: acylphosphatase [Desulfovibrionaceae bacterium]